MVAFQQQAHTEQRQANTGLNEGLSLRPLLALEKNTLRCPSQRRLE